MTPESLARIEIARRVSDAHLAIGMVASFVTGSSSEGIADSNSDIDMSLFWSSFPSEEDFVRIREQLDPNPPKWVLGSYSEFEFAVSIRMDGVEVQYGCGTVEAMDGYAADLLAGKYLKGPEQKIAMGTLIAIPLHGTELVSGWQQQFSQYPDSLRTLMIEAHRPGRQIAELYGKIEDRDSELWQRRELSELAYNILGMLAGYNRRWHSDFQLKRMHRFCDKLTSKPVDLAARIEFMVNAPLPQAMAVAQSLLDETVALVDRE